MKKEHELLLRAVKQDCRHFDASKPCKPHKAHGVFCDDCPYYSPKGMTVAVIKFGSIGDVLRTTAVLPALKEKYPDAHITWITAPNAREIFRNNPHTDVVLSDPSEYLPVAQTCRFDLLINLETDIRSSALATMMNADERFGFLINENGEVLPVGEESAEWYLMGVHDSVKKENTRTYFYHIFNVAGLTHAGETPQIFLSDAEKRNASLFREANNLSRFDRILGINTGSGARWPLKKWTMENHIALITKLRSDNPRTGLVLFGGPEENDYNNRITSFFGGDIVDAGTDNSMREFFSKLSVVDTLLTPDSLALHAGVALEKNVVVYTGPTSYAELDVFGRGKIVHSDMDCLVCYLNVCDKTVNCMNTLSVEVMYNALCEYL